MFIYTNPPARRPSVWRKLFTRIGERVIRRSSPAFHLAPLRASAAPPEPPLLPSPALMDHYVRLSRPERSGL